MKSSKKKVKEYKIVKRPPRVFLKKDGTRYIKMKGKKMKLDSDLPNKQLVKIVINNMSQQRRRKRGPRKTPIKALHSAKPPEATGHSGNKTNEILMKKVDDLNKDNRALMLKGVENMRKLEDKLKVENKKDIDELKSKYKKQKLTLIEKIEEIENDDIGKRKTLKDKILQLENQYKNDIQELKQLQIEDKKQLPALE
jgi:hypothetical protein